MKYTGDYNTRCPLCDTPITVGAHPILVRLNGEAKHGKRVCPTCFKPWLSKYSNMEQSLDAQMDMRSTASGLEPLIMLLWDLS